MRPFVRQRSTNRCSLLQMFFCGVRGTAFAVLGIMGLWLVPVPGAAQVPNSFATAGPSTHLALPQAVRVVTVGDDTRNDPTAPPQEVPFLPTMDQSVYDALKAEAEAEATAAPQLAEAPTPSYWTRMLPRSCLPIFPIRRS